MNKNEFKLYTNKLDLYYGDSQALKNININIEEKKVTALIGPSGCGKSTFLKTLNRMNDLIPNVKITGNVYFDGLNVYQEYDIVELRKKSGYGFSKAQPLPYVSL